MSESKTNAVNVYKELSPKLQKEINDIANKEGYVDYDIFCTSTSTQGGNFLSVLYEVDIKGKTQFGDKEKNIFIKETLNVDISSVFSIDKLFSNEALFYNEIAKMYMDLQEEANLPVDKRFQFIKSYGCDETTILMENATKKGFETLHKTKIGDWEYNKKCVNELAKFHALSFALEKKMPKYFEQKIRPLRLLYKFDDEWKKFFVNIVKFSISFFDGDIKTKLESSIQELCCRLINYFVDVDTSSLKCICHGDYRPNNVLMLKNEEQILSIIPIDFQMFYCGNPVMDFLYFIVFSTDLKFRKKYLTDLKDTYFDTFSTFLKYFDIEADDVYPRKEFEKYFNERQDFSLAIALLILPFLYGSEDNTPDFGDYLNGTANVDPIIGDRLRQLTDIINGCDL